MRSDFDWSSLQNVDQLEGFMQSIDDPRERAFMMFAYGRLLFAGKSAQVNHPSAPFDVIFYLQAMRAMFRHRSLAIEILQGDYSVVTWPEP